MADLVNVGSITISVPTWYFLLLLIACLILLTFDRKTCVGIFDRSITLRATISISSYVPAIELSFPRIFIHSLTVIFLNNLASLFVLGSES